MLSLANVSASHGATYYKVENYYSKKESVEFSRWAGKDAEKLGLVSAVNHLQFSALLKGSDPKIAVAGSLENRKRAGLDMTFSAPKSVSIQALVFGDHRLIEAHRDAVSEALAYAENNYAAYRAGGRADRVVRKGEGLLVAQFEHDSSRLKDPQLHTHNVVINRIENDQGEVRALHSDLIYKNSVLIGMIYQNSLAKKAQELGYKVKPNAHGTFEIEGYSKEQLTVFSKRKEQIETMNPDSYRETRELVLKNRKAKDGFQRRNQLLEKWEKEASKNNLKAAPSTIKIGQRHQIQKVEISSLTVVQQAIRTVTTKSVVFRQEEVMREALQVSLGKFGINDLESAFEKTKITDVLGTTTKGFFTTREAVQRELESRSFVNEGIGLFKPITSTEAARHRTEEIQKINPQSAHEVISKASEALKKQKISDEKVKEILAPVNISVQNGSRVPLEQLTKMRQEIIFGIQTQATQKSQKEAKKVASEIMKPLQKELMAPTFGQQEAIEKTLLSKDQYILWQGVAGAGKTYALRQIVEEAQNAGYQVKGFAPSATAAMQLAKEAEIAAGTLQSHLLKRDKITSEKSLWIVDEAGMVSAKDFHALQVKVRSQNARVLLVGDFRQLSPVDAGNPFLDIQKNTQTTNIHLTESLRQKDPELQAAVEHMNKGDVAEGLKVLSKGIHEAASEKGKRAFVAKEFLKNSVSEQESTLLLTRTNRTREDLTSEIRKGLKDKGFLKNEILMPVLRKLDVPQERLKYASTYSKGDIVVPNRSYQKHGLKKDHSYEVIEINAHKNVVTLQRGTEKIELSVSDHSQVSLFVNHSLPVAEGDKMIWNRNIFSKEQMNNAGFVVEKISKESVLIRTENGQAKILNLDEAQHMEHAWALTIYKSQGKTASNVLQVIDSGTTKRDILVGVTRAADSVILVAQTKEAALKNAKIDPQKAIAIDEIGFTVLQKIKKETKREMGR